MLRYLSAFVLVAFSPLLSAQLSLRNADVIHMLEARLGEDLIVTTVNAAPGYYDTSVDGLANLQRAGISDKELSAVVQKAFHICFAGTSEDHLDGLKQSQMEELLQQHHCGPHFDQTSPQSAKPLPGAATAQDKPGPRT
jgi:hypothetical protein